MRREDQKSMNNLAIYTEIIRHKTDIRPVAAIVLGSGLGSYGDRIDVACEIPYSQLPGFPVSTVPGHAGRFLIGYAEGVPVICMQGRVHMYEGYTAQQAVMPIRVMREAGAEYLIVSNAAGGIREDYSVGDIVLLSDHISLFVPNPLIGPNDDRVGDRFPDMTKVYDPQLREAAHRAAEKAGFSLKEGVYAQLTGPSYETPAEIRLLRTLGADLVGMSTVVETIAARHMGMRVCGLSLVTNKAAGITGKPLSDDEVKAEGGLAAPRFARLVGGLLREIGGIGRC